MDFLTERKEPFLFLTREALDDFREKRINEYVKWRKAHNGTPIPKPGTKVGDCEITALRKIAIELELKGIRGNCEILDHMASGGGI